MIFNTEEIKKWLGVITASFTVIGGGYAALEKFHIFEKPIITWHPENFSISNGPATGEFKVIVAREKHRDDCSVEGFKLEVRDSHMIVHNGKPSISKFSGPANHKVDKFGYTLTIENPEKVALGTATLLARIDYKCPEGNKIVSYPDHINLKFEVTKNDAP